MGKTKEIFLKYCVRGGGDGVAKKADIKKDLIDQLERNGVYGNHFLDVVEDYMSLWEIKNKLIRDIESRGVSIEWSNGGGQGGFKKNDSIGELNKTNAQMLKILNELGLKASKAEVIKDDEEM
ncbi:P27 family phage terminase small subunit [Pelosinus sp. Bkl1]|uniref:P27 family phage terminase small subunit n=1 Tax=Pelosinus baikalensis TaxID=2892015 RepID=A0ABS8HRK3_9FIRM|nr:P27 family phage terminase small subunit [Pelosinus baikalensis]MCC5465552.1 P27 family phage terminase small subunit [Pelosinus baikalensis]